ncbi:MAG: hypothetical protein BGP18_05890 [Stenotrophomonas sp. 69-14]|nr:MAG: hypothetical protein BGP18_05890 [Stenotrophomonas sp. 69-14]
MEESELDRIGSSVSTTVLVALALALAARDSDDARGTLRDLISAAEEQIGDSIRRLRHVIPDDQLERVTHSAQHNTMAVGRIADSLLRHMGSPPAQD